MHRPDPRSVPPWMRCVDCATVVDARFGERGTRGWLCYPCVRDRADQDRPPEQPPAAAGA